MRELVARKHGSGGFDLPVKLSRSREAPYSGRSYTVSEGNGRAEQGGNLMAGSQGQIPVYKYG